MGASVAHGQVTQDFAVDLKATPSSTAPHLTLNWAQRQQAAVIAQRVHRRAKNASTWTLQATLATSDTTWPDPTAVAGLEYEYWLERQYTGLSPQRPLGYLLAGADVPAVENRGVLLLVVDDTMASPLAPEIATLTDDLTGDGWTLQTFVVPRTDTPPDVKAVIQAAYAADPANVKAVYLLGHVPVPYSGSIAPDGHGSHIGAWPADGYFGDMDGTWTDATVTSSTISGSPARIQNVPGDGKFDQSSLPSNLELQVGRVDLSGMTQAPAANVTEAALLRRYLRKAHEFRHRLGAYASVPRRSMIRDGFGYFSGESFASSGWAAAFSAVGSQVDLPASGQWFDQATANTYLFGYGNGGGSYTSASTVGTSADFGRRPSRVVFTLLFGSFHGDWDSTNNFMRSALAGNATGDSLGLTCYWSGRPYFYLHLAGLGENIGYATRLSMNNPFSNYQPAGSFARGVHTGLMGDPSLRLHMVEPPRHFGATTGNGEVTLRWDATTDTDVLGYHVYRAPSPAGAFARLTPTPLAAPGFTDATATAGLAYRYMVRTLKREVVPAGSYLNLSQGALATLTVSAAATPAPFAPSGLTSQTTTSSQISLSWVDTASDETGFRIERRVNNGAFTVRGTVGANVTTFTDAGSLSGSNVYYHRVVALGAGGDSLPSEESAIELTPGFLDLSVARLKVNRSTGIAPIVVNRFGANFSPATVTGTTTNVSALAGTHYTTTTGAVTFTDLENGTRTVNVPIATGATPQLPRQFTYTLSAPGGSALAQQTVTRVLIEDPTATLPAPWTQTILGAVTDSSPAVFAENAIGSSVAGGSATTTDNGRFVYQSRTGDGVLTAFIDAPLPVQSSARYAVMVRGSTAADVAMASAQVATSTVGTNLALRTFTDGAVSLLPGTSSALNPPRWVRLTRSGDNFTAETSTDGGAWTTLGSSAVTIPSSALWGLYHHGDTSGNFQLARFRYVTLTAIGTIGAPTNFTATPQAPAQLVIAWDPVGGATSYEIERRPRNAAFAPYQTFLTGTVTFTDDVLPGVIYDYRIRASNGTAASAWVQRSVTAPGTAAPYNLWLQTNGLPMDGTGNGAPTFSVPNDGIWNAMKFSLGLIPGIRGYFGRLSTGTVLEGGETYNFLTYTRPEPPPAGNVYSVKTCADLGAWSAAETLEISSTVAGSLRTITVRDTIPASPANPRRFIRLEVVVP
jgi:fibronectin type 3 domain-containing protein